MERLVDPKGDVVVLVRAPVLAEVQRETSISALQLPMVSNRGRMWLQSLVVKSLCC